MDVWPRGGLWRHGDFLKLWSGQTVSQLGSQVSQLALPLAAIIVLEASALEVALLGTVEYLPFLLFALPAGVWVDRFRRRPIMIAADIGRAAALLSIPASYAADALTIWQLYAVGFLVGIGTVFFDVSYQSYLPSLVERGRLIEGNAKLEVSRSGAQLAGPGLAGALVGAITAPYAILVDAVSFIGSAGLLLRIRTDEARPRAPATPSMRRELAEGIRYLVEHRYWRPLAMTVAISNFFTTLAFSIVLVYAVRELDMSPAGIGVVLTVGNVGWLVGALTAGRISGGLGVGRTLTFSTLLFGPPMLLIPLAPPSSPIPLLVIGLMTITFGGVLFNITGISLLQAVTPDRLLGRLNATRRFIVWGVIPLGSLSGGVLASQIGLRETLFIGAGGASLASLPVILSPVRSIGKMADAVRDLAVPEAPPVDA